MSRDAWRTVNDGRFRRLYMCREREPRDRLIADYSCLYVKSSGGAQETIAQIDIESAHFHWYDDALSQIVLNVRTLEYDALRRALTLRFGPPRETAEEEVQTRAGLRLLNERTTWHIGEDIATLSRYGATIDRASLRMESRAGLLEFDRRQRERTLGGQKDM